MGSVLPAELAPPKENELFAQYKFTRNLSFWRVVTTLTFLEGVFPPLSVRMAGKGGLGGAGEGEDGASHAGAQWGGCESEVPISILNWICGLCPGWVWLILQCLEHWYQIPSAGLAGAHSAGRSVGAAQREHRRQIHWETICTGVGHSNRCGEQPGMIPGQNTPTLLMDLAHSSVLMQERAASTARGLLRGWGRRPELCSSYTFTRAVAQAQQRFPRSCLCPEHREPGRSTAVDSGTCSTGGLETSSK